MDLTALSLSEVQAGFRAGDFTPVEYLEALEGRIAAVEPVIGAFLERDFAAAFAAARSADVCLPLGGLPIGIKDAISVQGEPCTCASRILESYRAPYDATVIRKLRAAGAIPFGRLNMDEFAMGSTTETSARHPTRNPWDPKRIPGGSSGGSAAAVAACEVPVALGSDTGGSIRQPAALCGCVGVKPSYGRVSRYGLVAFASSLDQIGPLGRSVRDCATILNVLCGRDPLDSTSLDLPQEDFLRGLGRDDLKGVRLGLPKEYFVDGMDGRVRALVEAAVRQCAALGAEIIEVDLPHTGYAIPAYYIIATAEASANLARFDGIRYGRRADDSTGIDGLYERTRGEGFGNEVKRRIILGTHVLSAGYYDAYYLRAQKVRTLIRRDFEKALESVDALVCPVTPDPAFRIGEHVNDPLKLHLMDVFTTAANLAGICGLSTPCGFVEEDGRRLPVGLQFLGRAMDEARLLGIADVYERSEPWARERPPLVGP